MEQAPRHRPRWISKRERIGLRGARSIPSVLAIRAGVPATTPLLREAVRTVDRLVASRLERYPSLIAAARTGHREHLALAAGAPRETTRVAACAATAGLTVGAAVWAARWLVAESAGGKELLLPDGEGES